MIECKEQTAVLRLTTKEVSFVLLGSKVENEMDTENSVEDDHICMDEKTYRQVRDIARSFHHFQDAS